MSACAYVYVFAPSYATGHVSIQGHIWWYGVRRSAYFCVFCHCYGDLMNNQWVTIPEWFLLVAVNQWLVIMINYTAMIDACWWWLMVCDGQNYIHPEGLPTSWYILTFHHSDQGVYRLLVICMQHRGTYMVDIGYICQFLYEQFGL